MKLIKKIAAIMLSVMMVLGMASVVSAAGTTETGTITINDAINGQKYTIYKLLDLESYDKDKNLYSYKPAAEWKTFFEPNEQGKEYVDINANGYVTWKEGADAATLAQKALAYAKAGTNGINTKTEVTASGTTVTFSGLDLGYYLVDSSLGALCSLDTTNPTATIKEKNDIPTVEKKVSKDGQWTNLDTQNSVNLGDTVAFQTTINVKPGADNYVLHDVMNSHLTFLMVSDVIVKNDSDEHLAVNTYYTVEQNATDNCTFELRFTDEFYKKYANDINNKKVQQILVHYAATVKSDAPINTAMNNKTWLTYGDKNTESNKSETNTYTFGIPVFKYTGSNKALEGAKFKLYTDERCDDDNNALKFKKNNDNKYRYVQTTTQDGDIILTSLKDGHIDIEGIKEGVYYLKEIEAPKGYNKLKDPIKVKISDSGQVSILKSVPGGTETSEAITDYVKVLNNTGTILPTTGGNGTSLIYFLGAVLALVSGVVLITKQRMKNS